MQNAPDSIDGILMSVEGEQRGMGDHVFSNILHDGVDVPHTDLISRVAATQVFARSEEEGEMRI